MCNHTKVTKGCLECDHWVEVMGLDKTIHWWDNPAMLAKLKKLFTRKPSAYDQLIFNELQLVNRSIDFLNANIVALARLTLVTPDRLQRESINDTANTEYLKSLIKARDAKK